MIWLPQLDRVALGVVKSGEFSDLAVPFGPSLHRDSSDLKLRDHRAQIVHSKIYHPLLFGAPEIIRILREWRKDRIPGTLFPRQRVELVHTKMLFIPPSKRLRITSAKEHAAYAIYFLQNLPIREYLLPKDTTSRPLHLARNILGCGGQSPPSFTKKKRAPIGALSNLPIRIDQSIIGSSLSNEAFASP